MSLLSEFFHALIRLTSSRLFIDGSINWIQFRLPSVEMLFRNRSTSAVQFSIIWFITVETESALALTIASVVGLLPQAIIGLFAGVWIDRFNRKKIIILAFLAIVSLTILKTSK